MMRKKRRVQTTRTARRTGRLQQIAGFLVLLWSWAGPWVGDLHALAQPVPGQSVPLPPGPATVTFVLTTGELERKADLRVVFAGLAAADEGPPEIALVAAPEENWFSSGWELRLEAAAGIIAGDPGAVKLISGLAAPFLFPGETYRASLSFDPISGAISFVLHNVTRNAEIYAGALFVEPGAGRRLKAAVAGLAGVDPSRADRTGDHAAGVDPAGSGARGTTPSLRVEGVEVEREYRHRGELLPLAQVRTGVVSPGTHRFVTAIGLNEGPGAIRITRPFGRLPGWFLVLAAGEGEPAAGADTAVGDGRAERVLLTLPAEPLEIEASLGERALAAGRHTVRVVYQAPQDGVGRWIEEEVRSMSLEIRRPEVSARVRFAPLSASLMRLEGLVELGLDQPVDWLEVDARTPQGEVVYEERLENVAAGAITLPFPLTAIEVADLLQPVTLRVRWADGTGLEKVVYPFRVALAASGEMTQVTSYQQPVRQLVPPVEFEPEGGAPATYDLVELRVTSQLLETADRLGVSVEFTSPSGEVFPYRGRRLARGEVEGYWVARLLPHEPGRWSYRVTLTHPGWAPDGVTLQSGAFAVRDSGRQVPVVRRVWGESEPKPVGERVVALRYRRGNTVKLEQLIGDWDSHLDIPVRNLTLSDYGVIGTDLGQPFEHDGKLVILFGDTMGTRGFIESSMAYSETEDPEKGLALDFYTDSSGYALRIRPPGLRMAGFEVPSGGMSIDGRMYFIVKDQMTEEPLGMTFRSVLIRFDEERREFIPVREFSPYGGKFAEVVARPAPEGLDGLPFDGPALLVWGSGEYYRKGSLYLAVTRPETIEEEGRMYYFAGTDASGRPVWARSEAEAVPVVRHSQIGEFSVVYSEDLGIWLLTYNSGAPRGINLQWARTPWGPWERPQVIFEPWLDGGYARFMHALNMPDASLAGPVINPQPPAVQQWGGEYAPYMIERFLRHRDGTLTIYYLMSTWNPYVVVLMRTDLDVIFAPEF